MRELSLLPAGTREVTSGAIVEVLGGNVRVVSRHNTPTIQYYFGRAGRQFVLKVGFPPALGVMAEADWYRYAARAGRPTAPFLAAGRSRSFAFLLLARFGDGRTLDDVALAGAPEEFVREAIDHALALDRELFDISSRPASTSAIDALLGRRVSARLSEARGHPYLRHLLQREFLVVNGRRLPSPVTTWHNLRQRPATLVHVTPSSTGRIHGDLHCGNILVRGRRTALVDPRGSELRPLEYDLGKVLQSLLGGYGAIMTGRYDLAIIGEDRYSIAWPSAPGYEAYLPRFQSAMQDREIDASLFLAAQHLLAMLPHHAVRQHETIALFLSACLLFQALQDRLS